MALFHAKTRRWQQAQDQIDFSKLRPNQGQPTAWFHAASLGEFEQGRPVIEAFRRQYPAYRIVLTFFSPSGYEVRKNYDGADAVLYLPADTPANVKRFLDAIQPNLVFFIKYEFWYNYLHELRRRQIPTLLFSAIFRPNQLFFKTYGGFYRKMLFCFDAILVQNQASKTLLELVQYRNAIFTGDTRFDRVAQIVQQAPDIPEIVAFKNNKPLLVVGSAWPDDMEVLIPFLNQFNKPLQVIIAPHEIDLAQIENWQKRLQQPSVKWSELNRDSAATILFIDCIGLLSSLYRYADFAFIGGAYGDGLHNILEPAAFGMPLFFGDLYYDKFQEALDLLNQGAAYAIENTEELEQKMLEIYEDEQLRGQQAEICRRYVQSQAGATERVMDAATAFMKV